MATETGKSHVQELTDAQGWQLLEERTRRRLQISADEFVRRWRTGVYGDADDNPDALEIAVLLPIVGIDPWRSDQRT